MSALRVVPHRDDPAPRLAEVFEEIRRTRMDGVLILNDALQVDALGFRRHAEGWIGALVTPWFLNFMLLPAQGAAWTSRPEGTRHVIQLPGGPFEFLHGYEDLLGEYCSCALISPMAQFTDHETARMAAHAALAAAFDPQTRNITQPEPMETEARPLVREMRERAAAPMSKREFLRGGVFRK